MPEHKTKMWKFSPVLSSKSAGSKICTYYIVFDGTGVPGMQYVVLEIGTFELHSRTLKEYIFWYFT